MSRYPHQPEASARAALTDASGWFRSYPRRVSQGILQARIMRRLDFQLAALVHAPDAMKQAARRWSRGTLAVFVVDAPMTGTQKESRTRKPRYRTSKMSAIHRQNSELLPRLAVRAETACVPQHGRPQGTLGPIVGWLDPLHTIKGPQRRPRLAERTAERGCVASASMLRRCPAAGCNG